MKTLAVALSHVLLVVAIAGGAACSTTQVAKTPAQDPARAALVQELNALVAQGPLYFETDKDTLTEGSRLLLQRIAAQMHRVPEVRVLVGGHADERGDTAYNLALGERRGVTAREYLLALGVASERIQVVSLGEEQPAADAHEESAWAMNRRDEFTFLLPGDTRSALHIGAGDLLATTSFGNE